MGKPTKKEETFLYAATVNAAHPPPGTPCVSFEFGL